MAQTDKLVFLVSHACSYSKFMIKKFVSYFPVVKRFNALVNNSIAVAESSYCNALIECLQYFTAAWNCSGFRDTAPAT